MNKPRWHLGLKTTNGKHTWWLNQWIGHHCADLAYPFEVGTRAAQS